MTDRHDPPADLRARAIALYDDFTHRHHDRRAFMGEMTRLAGGSAAAAALVATIAADPASATVIAEDDPRLTTGLGVWEVGEGRRMTGYTAFPDDLAGDHGTVIVIHENRGLNAHTEDVARRAALAGFFAIAPDFLSTADGHTPRDNEDLAREMIGKLDLAQSVADGVALVAEAKGLKGSNGKVGVVGFCWGGAMTNRIAVAAGDALAAASAFYGPAPAPAEASKVKAAIDLHYAGSDDRVNATAGPWHDALKAAGAKVRRFDYPGTQHAFHNDASAARYNAEAAALAWDRTIALFKERLA